MVAFNKGVPSPENMKIMRILEQVAASLVLSIHGLDDEIEVSIALKKDKVLVGGGTHNSIQIATMALAQAGVFKLIEESAIEASTAVSKALHKPDADTLFEAGKLMGELIVVIKKISAGDFKANFTKGTDGK